jgi:hypothetical protein
MRAGIGACAARGGAGEKAAGISGEATALRRGGGAGGRETCGGDGVLLGPGGAGGLETTGGGIGERDAAGGGGGGGRDGTFTFGAAGVNCASGEGGAWLACGAGSAWLACGVGPRLEGGAGGRDGEGEGSCRNAARGGSEGFFDVFARGGAEPEPAALVPSGEDGFRDDVGGGDGDLDPMAPCYQGILNLIPSRKLPAQPLLTDYPSTWISSRRQKRIAR